MRRALPDLSDVRSSPDGSDHKTHRKPHFVHKANTIGIPSESDLHDGKNNHHRSRKNIFEGFRNTLRNKHKSDTGVLEVTVKEHQEKNDFNRRWSDNNQSTVNIFLIFLYYMLMLFSISQRPPVIDLCFVFDFERNILPDYIKTRIQIQNANYQNHVVRSHMNEDEFCFSFSLS